MTPVLAVAGLTKRFGGLDALDNVSFDIAAGEFVAVLGPSGSGKSTLFRCITRLIEPDAGSIEIDRVAFGSLKGRALRQARGRIGVVFQQFNLVRRRTALANVMTGALPRLPLWRIASGLYPEGLTAKAETALASVGLASQRYQRADTLSGGQQQRVAIARALMQETRILLADEPVASLDPHAARLVLGLMREMAKSKGLAILCTLHQPELAAEFADRILLMRSGRLAAPDA
ncbi:phosphonate ABC transporter ATP-binding protein [Rhabdaerophilum sp. SD176]|uniref:phosphonate ABC transporter ATP-binding protein n=1 Tax=Rhabdaerophilum sp. SD176 TaxID=2983548 RepID=UPI0024DF574F|nr:phosphonate ABC transporter ATP-binding protein [Rhabdaerophilum sp. SD176]